MFLYHMILPFNHPSYVNPEEVMDIGLSPLTATKWYGCGGKLYPDLTEKTRPLNAPNWLNFNNAIVVELTPPKKRFFIFPKFTNRILVFNKDISTDLFSYIEDEYIENEAGKGYFTKGVPEKEVLMERYWSSMMELDDYLVNPRYTNIEVLLFESVPKKMIEKSI